MNSLNMIDDKVSDLPEGNQGEYEFKTSSLLMEKSLRGAYHYTLEERRNRVVELLKIEGRARELCRSKTFTRKDGCPYCGWFHN